jgi:hypothetical protein
LQARGMVGFHVIEFLKGNLWNSGKFPSF